MILRLVSVSVLAAALAAGVLTGSALGMPNVPGSKPAVETKAKSIGKVIATPARLGIYYWDVEKKAGGKIRCTGKCAVAWPPVYVTGKVAKHVKGVMATFGSIKRGARRQLTVNGLPAYTYQGDSAGVVLCDNTDGWHVVRP